VLLAAREFAESFGSFRAFVPVTRPFFEGIGEIVFFDRALYFSSSRRLGVMSRTNPSEHVVGGDARRSPGGRRPRPPARR
jgi:hypothetical protein